MASGSSWFSLDKITELKDKVEKAIPRVDDELIQKLTLRTPEMQAERANLEEAEKRRKHAARYLTQMLPWETKDPEREILVEECKEAIMALSTKEESFLGPYLLPATEGEEEAEGGPPAEVEESAVVEGSSTEDGISSADKLAKLEPLPPLLEKFDLDTHVGLIRRLLDMDPNLVEMQSRLTAGGDKEMTFWRNYFFHCAYTRYEAGLSIDEIWAPKPEEELSAAEAAELTSDGVPSTKEAAAAVAAAASNVFSVASGAAMSFMSKAKAATASPPAPAGVETAAPVAAAASSIPAPAEGASTATPAAAAATPATAQTAPPAAAAATQTPEPPPVATPAAPSPAPAASSAANTPASSSGSSDFEVVSTSDAAPKPAAAPTEVEEVDLDDDEAIFGGGDPELDELEAEIAKELED